MQPTLAEDIFGLTFDIGQAVGIVSPSIQKTVKQAEALTVSSSLSESQRRAMAGIGTIGRLLGVLQVFQAATENRK